MTLTRTALVSALIISLTIMRPLGAEAEPVIKKIPATIKLTTDKLQRGDTPVTICLADTVKAEAVKLTLGGQTVPCQIIPGTPRRLTWLMPKTTVGQTLEYRVEAGAAGAIRVKANKDDKKLVVQLGNKPLFQYNQTPFPSPKSIQQHNVVVNRTGFIHPLYTPEGKVLTTIYPADHLHHMGLWHPWTHTKYENRKVDFWNLKTKAATMRFKSFAWEMSGPVCAGFAANQEHVVLKRADGPKVAMTELFTVVAWPTPDGTGYTMDYQFVQTATDKEIIIGPYRYGGFGYRARLDWLKKNSDYLTSTGKSRDNGNYSKERWCRIQGEASDGPGGLLFMSNPTNTNHPEDIRIWNSKQKWIFFNFNPAQKKKIIIKPGQSHAFRYRIFVYDGNVSKEECERRWQCYAKPPMMAVE